MRGFATWVSYLVTDILFPEWKIWNHFLRQTTDGLRMDALEQSHPIEVEVHHACSVIEYFDAISYEKGSVVIRMLQDFLRNEIFQVQKFPPRIRIWRTGYIGYLSYSRRQLKHA